MTKQSNMKKDNKQTNSNKNKKIHVFYFMLASHYFVWNLPWIVDDIVNPLEKTIFSIFQEISIAKNLLVGGKTPNTVPHLSAGTPSGLNHCKWYVYYYPDSESAYVHQHCCVCFLGDQHHLSLTVFPLSLLHRSLSLEGAEFDVDISFRIECSKVSHTLHIVQL